jgi:transglutaminase-like putative cysteine protease
MKKIIISLCVLLLLIIPMANRSADGFATVNISTSIQEEEHMLFVLKTTSINLLSLDIQVQTVEATVVVTKGTTNYTTLKAIVEKEDEYIYNLVSDIEYLPLQMGSGTYKVSLLGSNDGRRYRSLTSKNFTVELEENAVFLSSSQTVNWNDETDVTIQALALTKDLVEDEEKLVAIHTYIVENVKYDYVKATQLPKGYIPNAVATYEEGMGICYDFAALLGSMMRAVDVPTKLVKGYSSYTPVYHAWNEVLIDDEWWIVDSSTDSIYVDYNATYIINKPITAYVASKVY